MLTPDDIQKKIFALGRKLENNDVGIFVKEMQINYQLIYDQVNEQKKQISGMEKKLTYYRDVEGNLKDALVHAEKVADVKISEAKNKADKIELEAHKKAEEIIADAKSELAYLKSVIVEFEEAYDVYQNKYKDFIEGQIKFIDDSKKFMEDEKVKVKKFVSNIDIEPSVSKKTVDDIDKDSLITKKEESIDKSEAKEEPKFKMPQFDLPKPQVEEQVVNTVFQENIVEEFKVEKTEVNTQEIDKQEIDKQEIDKQEIDKTEEKLNVVESSEARVNDLNNDVSKPIEKSDDSTIDIIENIPQEEVTVDEPDEDDLLPDLSLTDYASTTDDEEIVLTNNMKQNNSEEELENNEDDKTGEVANTTKDNSSDFDKFAAHMSFDNFDIPEKSDNTFSFAKMMAGNSTNDNEEPIPEATSKGVEFNPGSFSQSAMETPVVDTQKDMFNNTQDVSNSMDIPSIEPQNNVAPIEQNEDLFSLPEIDVDDLDFSNLRFNDDSSSMDFDDIPSLDSLGSGVDFNNMNNSSTGVDFNNMNNQSTGVDFNSMNNQSTGVDFNSMNNQSTGVDFNSINNQSTGVDFNSMNNQSTGVDFNSMNNQPVGLKKPTFSNDGKPRLPKSLDDTSTVNTLDEDDNGPSLSQNANIELTFANNSMFPKKKNDKKEKLLASLNISSNKDAEKAKIRQMESNYAKDLLGSNQQLASNQMMDETSNDQSSNRGYGPNGFVNENNGFASKPLNPDAANNNRPLF